MLSPTRTHVDPDLGLTFSIFEPYSNLSPEQKAAATLGPKSPEPIWHERGVRLYQGDALELLRRAKSQSFDLIFADPPYFLSSGGITCQNGQMVSVDKGDWDKSATPAQIHEFNTQWLRECHRLLKPDGAIWVSGTSHNIYSVGFALQTLGFKILNDIAWQKTNPPPHLACRYFTHAHETLLWARKTPKAKHYFDYAAMKHDNGDKQMQSVWRLPAPTKWEKRFGKHPTQKPEILLDRIIRASSRPGDLVLDPFCGSGTTGVVAARQNRRFVGFEIEMDFLNLAQKRLHDELHTPQQSLQFCNEIVGGGGGVNLYGKRRGSPQAQIARRQVFGRTGKRVRPENLPRENSGRFEQTYPQQRMGGTDTRTSLRLACQYSP